MSQKKPKRLVLDKHLVCVVGQDREGQQFWTATEVAYP